MGISEELIIQLLPKGLARITESVRRILADLRAVAVTLSAVNGTISLWKVCRGRRPGRSLIHTKAR